MKLGVMGMAAAVLAAALVGCGGNSSGQMETVPVKGTLKVDGKAYGPVLMTLTPTEANSAAPTVNGYVDQSGAFTLQTYEAGDGAPPGSYTVGLTMDPMRPGQVPAVKPVTVVIKEDQPTLDINLEKTGEVSGLGGAPVPGMGNEKLRPN